MKEQKLYPRDTYLKRILSYKDTPLIKVITGIRRCGKSSILKMVQEYIVSETTAPVQIISINKELMTFDHIKTAQDLWLLVENVKKENPTDRIYLFVDEVQEIVDWEKAVTSILAGSYADIYITGSNAHLLSSELATYLTGRYVTIPVYPLTYSEYLVFSKKESSVSEFTNFIKFGGMPGIFSLNSPEVTAFQYLSDLFDSMVLKDVVQRGGVRDVALLKKLCRFLYDTAGSIFSASSVVAFLKNERRTISMETIYNYLHQLENAFAVYRVPRFDIRGKRHLEVLEKYFPGDIGLRNTLTGFRDQDISGLLENVVFLELKKRGFSLSVGKWADREIDFIAEKAGEYHYYQIAATINSPETSQREYAPLHEIPDNYPKTVLSLDQIGAADKEGIQWKNVLSFLTEE
jgi:hypothetical protein